MHAEPNYYEIVRHYEDCFAAYGDSHKGVDWPVAEDVPLRYRVMLDCVRAWYPGLSIMDFGCGTSGLYEFIESQIVTSVDYCGVDLAPAMIECSRQKYPCNDYACVDILANDTGIGQFDYVIANGVFTEKLMLTQDEMFAYFRELTAKLFSHCRIGMAFNVMSTHVDWQRDDLFHVSLDDLAGFLGQKITRDYVIRNDYGLYEYTTYLYKQD